MDITKFLIKIVKEASLMIKDTFEVKIKEHKGDLVTSFDYEIETFLTSKIKEKYPEFDVIGEEFNSSKKLTKNCFVIDPIDGTINFANHIPLWVIQVACIKDGEFVSSVIYAPKLNELYYADETGAYLNNSKIHVNDLSVGKGIYCITGKKPFEAMTKLSKKYKIRRYGSVGIEFAFTACGRLNAAIYRNDKVWDYIPGLYLAKQAGAFTLDEKGAHIVANSKEALNLLKANASYGKKETLF